MPSYWCQSTEKIQGSESPATEPPLSWFINRLLMSHSLPAALRAAQACLYLIYSEADFEVFRPAGATRCTDGVKFGISMPNFTPLVQRQGCRTPKIEIFTQIWPKCGIYPLHDIHKICRVCTSFQDASLNAEVQKKRQKLGFFAATGWQNKPIETKFCR